MSGLINEEVPADESETGNSNTGGTRIGKHLRSTGRHLCGRAGGSNVTGDAGTEQHSRYFGRIPDARELEETTQEKREMDDIHRALDEIFAETPQCSSHQGIQQLTEVMIATVEASAGRTRKTTHVPFLVGHEKEALKDRKQYLWLCAQVRSAPDPATLRK